MIPRETYLPQPRASIHHTRTLPVRRRLVATMSDIAEIALVSISRFNHELFPAALMCVPGFNHSPSKTGYLRTRNRSYDVTVGIRGFLATLYGRTLRCPTRPTFLVGVTIARFSSRTDCRPWRT